MVYIVTPILSVALLLLALDGLPKHGLERNSASQVIAEVKNTVGDVRSRRPTERFWDKLASQSRLMPGFELQTLEDSHTTLRLSGGSELRMEEKTGIRFMESSRIEFQRGKVRRTGSEASAKLEMRAGDRVISFSPEADFSVSRSLIALTSGKASFSEEGTAYELREGEEIAFSQGKSPKIRRSAFALQQPKSAEEISLESYGALKFRWKMDPNVSADNPLELEISSDPRFESDVKSLRIGATHPPLENVVATIHLPATKAPRKFFWRVRALSRAQMSSIESFSLRLKE